MASVFFPMETQQQSQWCWAAVSVSTASYYGDPAWSQCALVNAELGETGCCANGASSACNQPWSLQAALTRVGHLSSFSLGRLGERDTEAQIAAGRPVAVRIDWGDGTGHFVVVSGMEPDDIVTVEDPLNGTFSGPYSSFAAAYLGSGSWSHTYLTA